MKSNIFLYISIILFILLLLYIGVSLIFYRRKKIQWLHVIEQYSEALADKPTLPIQDRVESTQNLFNLIDILIDYTIISDREYDILLEKKSKNLDVEDAIERISKAVFNSIQPSVYTDVNNVVTKECLMFYIQKRTFVEYFMYLKRVNEGAD